jgi:capsular polysaccharide biosynthesis protein
MELRDYLHVIRRRGWIILVVALIAALAAGGVSKLQTPTYKASIRLSAEPARLEWGLTNTIKDILRSYVVRLNTHNMAQQVIDRAQFDMSTDELKSKLTISSDASNFTIQIDAKDTDPIVAMQIVQTMGDLFVIERDRWNQDQNKRDRVVVTIVDDVRQAELYSPKTAMNALAGLILGAIVGALIVLVLEWLESDIVRTPEDVERFVGWTVLGTIPSGARLAQSRRKTVQ